MAYGEYVEAQGQLHEAEAALAEAASLGRQRFSAVRRYASFLERLGRSEEAAAFLEDYLRRYPDDFTAHLDLGFIYMRLDRWQQAVGALQQAARRPELEFMARSNLAGAYMELRQIENAIQEWRRVTTMGPGAEYQQYLQHIAIAYENLDLPEQACDAWQSFLDRFPNSILGAERVLALADRCGTEEMKSRAALRLAALSPELAIDAALTPRLEIAGVARPEAAITPGSTLTLEVWFQVVRAVRHPTFVSFSLQGSDGTVYPLISEPDAVGTPPLWRGDTVRQPFAIRAPEVLAGGTYTLRIHSAEEDGKTVTLWPFDAVDAQGDPE
ncbi:MAG: tetratricopeptide repeat protein [Candidatus Hydrogenedentes bacterium]|nr:tetratricopeptide repeat protein [Candidatus Hydrogenedentota bacterium]